MSDNDALQLSGELVQQLQDVLAQNDPRCRDPLVATQYMGAIMGYVLASPADSRGSETGLPGAAEWFC
jgi:hypothetical protein